MRRMIKGLAACVAVSAAGFIAGCVSGQDASSGAVRFLNAVPDSPPMSLSVDDRFRASGYAYAVGSGFVALAAGTHDIRIDALLPDGADEDETTDLVPMFEATAPLRVNDETTFVVVGNYGTQETVQIPTRTRVVTSGVSRVQFLHGAVGGQPLDIYVLPQDAEIEVDTLPIASGLAYKSFTDELDLPAGNARVLLTPVGQPATILYDSGPIILTLNSNLLLTVVPNLAVDAAIRPFIVVVLTAGGSSALLDDNTESNLRVVNASPGTYALDVFINETSVDNEDRQVCDPNTVETTTLLELCALPFGYIGPYQALDPGTYEAKVQHSTDTALEARSTSGAFAAGAQSTLLMGGLIPNDAEDTEITGRILTSTRRVAPFSQFRVVSQSVAAAARVEGAPTTDRIELYITEVGAPLADEEPDFAGLVFGSSTGYEILLPGNYQVTVAESDTATPDVAPVVLLTQEVSLDGSGVYTLLLADSVGGVEPLQFISLEDATTP